MLEIRFRSTLGMGHGSGYNVGRARDAALTRLTSWGAATSVGNGRLSRSFALPDCHSIYTLL